MKDFLFDNLLAYVAGIATGVFSKIILWAWRATFGFGVWEKVKDFLWNKKLEKMRRGMIEITGRRDWWDKYKHYIKTGEYQKPLVRFPKNKEETK